MDDLLPVLWRQGLFLTPQHMQQQDRALLGTVATLGRLGPGFGWGVARLDLQEAALARGVVDLAELVAVTPEGTLLSAGTRPGPQRNARLRARQVRWPSSAGPLEVHVCIARETDAAAPLAGERELAAEDLVPRRFVVEEAGLVDRFDRDIRAVTAVQRLAYLAQLAIIPLDARGDAPRRSLAEGFDSLLLARLRPRSEGFEIDPTFVPPTLTLEAAPLLAEAIRAAADRILAAIAEVAPEPGARGLRLDLGVPPNLSVFLLLRSLHEHGSALLQLVEQQRVAPAEAYFRLRQAIADLAAFSPFVSVLGEVAAGEGRPGRPALPPYRHLDAGPGFVQALETLRLLLEGIRGGPQIYAELAHVPPATWRAEQLPLHLLEARVSRFFLRVESTLPAGEVQARLREAKFASMPEMPKIVAKRLFGVPLRPLADAPPGLPINPRRFTYLEFDCNHDDWKRILRDRSIEALCPDLPPETRLRLYREASAG